MMAILDYWITDNNKCERGGAEIVNLKKQKKKEEKKQINKLNKNKRNTAATDRKSNKNNSKQNELEKQMESIREFWLIEINVFYQLNFRQCSCNFTWPKLLPCGEIHCKICDLTKNIIRQIIYYNSNNRNITILQ